MPDHRRDTCMNRHHSMYFFDHGTQDLTIFVSHSIVPILHRSTTSGEK